MGLRGTHFIAGCLLGISLAFSTGAAFAADPPARVARLGSVEGAVSFAPAADDEWTDAPTGRPLVPGDRLWSDKGARAEVQAGSASLRTDGLTQLELRAIDDRQVQFALRQGTLSLRVRNLPEGENFEVDTPHLAWRVAYPGDFRLDVDPVNGTTRVTVLSGAGTAYGEGGRAMPLGGGQQFVFKGRALGVLASRESPPEDGFDRWVAERNRREDQSVAARHVPRELVGYQQLDAFGQWREDATLGPVWVPSSVPAGWAPYRMGQWSWVAPWGWTWQDDAPWGFATSHYGRWAQRQGQWAWVPGVLTLRPVYAPAMVAFAAVPGGNPSHGGKRGVAWFPLAPGEPWRPAFEASPDYVAAANPRMPAEATAYTWQRRPEAVSAVEGELAHGRPAPAAALRIALGGLVAGFAPARPVAVRGVELASARSTASASASVATAAPAAPTPPAASPVPPAVAQGPAAPQPAAPAPAPAPALPPAAAQAPASPPAASPAPARVLADAKPGADTTPAARQPAARKGSAPRIAKRAGGMPRVATASVRRQAREQQLAQARRAADRASAALRREREEAEALVAWQRHQQAVAEQFRRDQRAWEQRQRGIPVLRTGPAG